MTSLELYINQAQRIGPLEIWPMKLTGLSRVKYQVAPNVDHLFFREFDEGDGPEIGRIEVFNPTSTPSLIPSGWVIGGDLLQVRTFDSSEFVEPLASVVANVSCVEKGRWGEGITEVDGGRAPLSVQAAGRLFNRNSRLWSVDYSLRQQTVWQRVSTIENRNGKRPTNSLKQIMEEDSLTSIISQTVVSETSSSLKLLRGQNAFVATYEGVPLFLECFSSASALRKSASATLQAISLDLDQLEFKESNKELVREFIESSSIDKLTATQRGLTSMHFLSGNENVDTNAITDKHGQLLHITALNRAHRILQEV